jgi:hypothetical protein
LNKFHASEKDPFQITIPPLLQPQRLIYDILSWGLSLSHFVRIHIFFRYQITTTLSNRVRNLNPNWNEENMDEMVKLGY